jgi:hypothetical protein
MADRVQDLRGMALALGLDPAQRILAIMPAHRVAMEAWMAGQQTLGRSPDTVICGDEFFDAIRQEAQRLGKVARPRVEPERVSSPNRRERRRLAAIERRKGR